MKKTVCTPFAGAGHIWLIRNVCLRGVFSSVHLASGHADSERVYGWIRDTSPAGPWGWWKEFKCQLGLKVWDPHNNIPAKKRAATSDIKYCGTSFVQVQYYRESHEFTPQWLFARGGEQLDTELLLLKADFNTTNFHRSQGCCWKKLEAQSFQEKIGVTLLIGITNKKPPLRWPRPILPDVPVYSQEKIGS